MSTTVMDLGSQALVFVARFRRMARRGAPFSGEGLREEFLQLFRELDQQAQVESGLAGAWDTGRQVVVYLVDEVMINTEWEYRGWWGDNSLESALLGHPQKMRGILFYDALDQALRALDTQRTSTGLAIVHHADLLTLFYCALRFGFEGKFAGQPAEIERIAQQVLAGLPAHRRGRDRELFRQAYDHTVEVAPTYETYLRVATVIGIAAGLAVMFFGIREYLWTDLLHDLQNAATAAGTYFADAPAAGDG